MPLTKLVLSSYKYTFSSLLQKEDGRGRENETLQWCALSCKTCITAVTATQRHSEVFTQDVIPRVSVPVGYNPGCLLCIYD